MKRADFIESEGLDLLGLHAVLARQAFEPVPTPASTAALLQTLIDAGLADLPLPAGGSTAMRWRALMTVASHDLSLAKLYEGHTDALAILAELNRREIAPADSSWGTWAAESPDAKARIATGPHDTLVLNGRKAWCSGAGSVSHGLLTAWRDGATEPQLVAIDCAQPGVTVIDSGWAAVGMAASASLTLEFSNVIAQSVGDPGAYLRRPGFWQGGAGIAACWHGGALSIARALRASMTSSSRGAPTVLKLAALGKVDLAMQQSAALLRHAADWIDAHPGADASAVALRTRLGAEAAVRTVLDEAGRAMGATPFCTDHRFARMAADLPVFVRQSHADRDFAALGERCLVEEPTWQ